MTYYPSTTLEAAPAAHLEQARLIFKGLPATGPEHYLTHRQPHYPDTEALIGTMAVLLGSDGVATFGDIMALRSQLADVQLGKIGPAIIDGRCAEPLYSKYASDTEKRAHVVRLADERVASYNIVKEIFPDAICIPRAGLQMGKPRSEAQDAKGNVPYMGDIINGAGVSERTPDPERTLLALEQARALDAELRGRGLPTWFAHEGLLLPFEHGMLRTDPESGQLYSKASHLIWAGERTRDPQGPHIQLLGKIANPVGVKIGPSAKPEDIAALQQALNPDNIPGKLLFMIRMGMQHEVELEGVVGAIATYAPTSLTCFDVHGSTIQVERDGIVHKVRSVPTVIGNIAMTADAAARHNLRLRVLNVETIGDLTQYQCVDTTDVDDLPRHPGGVDPQLNPPQFKTVLEGAKEPLSLASTSLV